MEIIIARICVFLAIWKAPSLALVPPIPTAQLCGGSSRHDYDCFHFRDESTAIPWELRTQVSLEGTPMSLGFLGKCCDSWAHSLLVPPCVCGQGDSWVTVQHLEPGCHLLINLGQKHHLCVLKLNVDDMYSTELLGDGLRPPIFSP